MDTSKMLSLRLYNSGLGHSPFENAIDAVSHLGHVFPDGPAPRRSALHSLQSKRRTLIPTSGGRSSVRVIPLHPRKRIIKRQAYFSDRMKTIHI